MPASLKAVTLGPSFRFKNAKIVPSFRNNNLYYYWQVTLGHFFRFIKSGNCSCVTKKQVRILPVGSTPLRHPSTATEDREMLSSSS